MARPCDQVRARSITAASVLSIINGSLTFRITCSRKRSMSCISSRSGSARQTSRIWAPERAWARPISLASSNFSSAMSRLKRREPMTLVRSPTRSGRFSSVASTQSMPL